MSLSDTLTKQFYEWEKRGRGWQRADYPVDLEPPFVPFFRHDASEEIIDDGKHATFLSAIADLFKQKAAAAPIATEKPEQEPFPFTDTSPLRIYSATLPQHFKQSADRIEQLLVMLSYRKSPISFEIIATASAIVLQWACRQCDESFFVTQVLAFFPDCPIQKTANDAIDDALDRNQCFCTVDYGLQEEFMRPIASHANLEHEPLLPAFAILDTLVGEQMIIVQVLFSGTHNTWSESIMRSVTDDSYKFSFFADAPEMPQLAQEKIARPLFGVCLRIVTASATSQDARIIMHHLSTAIVHSASSSYNSLIPLSDSGYPFEDRMEDIYLRQSRRLGMLLNSRELATFVHYPSAAVHSKKLPRAIKHTKAAPGHLKNPSYVLGENIHQGVIRNVGIGTEQRLRHMHLIGATGTGKSTLLHSLVMQDIASSVGVCVLDPHGDLIERIMADIPESRAKDVILVDPADRDFPIGFNILATHSDIEKELVASDLVALFRRFSTSWGDQMNSVFANAIMALLYNTQVWHLGDLRKFLIEPPLRAAILATCTDADIVYYWQKEFPLLRSASIAPILTRLDTFLRPKVIRNMVCQTNSLNFREMMDANKIVLVKLSEGLVGAENSYLLGAFIVAKLQQLAMARQAQAAASRIPFFCYIDEFHHFITPSMASILTGARKYGVGLVLAHQDMQQVAKHDAEIATSLLANAGTRIAFRLGDTDAKRLQDGFSGFTAEDLQNLAIGEAIVRVNTADCDFNIAVTPLSTKPANCQQQIIEHSRKAYCTQMQPHDAALPKSEPTAPRPAPAATVTDAPPPKAATPAPSNPKKLREHVALQTLIKKLAEEHGYRASIEVTTPDGKGQVDVLIEKDGAQIAVEVSVTTTATWELHNVRKCLAAGYGRVVVCTTTAAKAAQIQKRIHIECTQGEQAKIMCIHKEEIQSMFIASVEPKETTRVMKGYRINVKFEDGGDRQQLLQSIIQATKKV